MRPDLVERLMRAMVGKEPCRSSVAGPSVAGPSCYASEASPLRQLRLLRPECEQPWELISASADGAVEPVPVAEVVAMHDCWIANFGGGRSPEMKATLAAQWVRATLRNDPRLAGPEGTPDRCLHCGEVGNVAEPLLPFLRPGWTTERPLHDWLHRRCSNLVATRRSSAAECAMRAAGLTVPPPDLAGQYLTSPGGLPEGFEISFESVKRTAS